MSFIRKKYVFNESIVNDLHILRKLDNWHGLIAVLYDYLVIAAAFIMFFITPWLYPVTLILIGSRQRALATILHESVHKCLAKSNLLNYCLGTYLSGYLIFQEFNTYRDSHVKRHHAYLGDENKDPDYHYHINEHLYQYHGCFRFFKHYILKPLFLLKTGSYLWYLILNRMKPSKQYIKSYLAMYVYWAAIIAFAIQYNFIIELFLLWFVPLITTSAVIGWFNELAEHYPLVAKNRTDIYMTRNRFSHWFEHFIFNTHEENYHLIHHLQASIPFWNLKKAHNILSRDAIYEDLNKNMGGIFCSKNDAPSLIMRFLSQPTIDMTGAIQYE